MIDRRLIRAVANAVFAQRDVDEVMGALDAYGIEPHEPERDRVQLAILKLCDEQGLDSPGRFIDAAKTDYRDVLAWAEYPNQMNVAPGSALLPDEKASIEETDRAQYTAWLRRWINDDANPTI